MSNIEQYKILHQQDSTYGITGGAYLEEVCLFIDFLKPKTVLDYGCGKGALIKELSQRYQNISFYGYDPAIPGRDVLPVEKADFIINTDVLEHIPENELPAVIEQIARISQNVFFVLHHYPAEQILPNGENAHCTVKPPAYYHNLLGKYFPDIVALKSRGPLNSVVLTFKLLPEYIFKYNRMLESPAENNSCEYELEKIKEVLSFVLKSSKKSIKRTALKYRILSHLFFGKRARKYRQKYKEYKNFIRTNNL